MENRHVALDFETSGLRPEDGHVPLTLGFAWRNDDGDIESRKFAFKSGGPWEIEAMTVNKLGAPAVHSDVYAQDYDFEICQFLTIRFGNIFEMKGKLVPVGWNVGSFDMRFMHKYFPQASKFFSHRPFELNTMAFCIDQLQEFDFKKKAKLRAEALLYADNWHDAVFDAKASLIAFEYGIEILNS